MEGIVRKNGLLYTPDMHTVLGVDVESGEFNGRIPFGAHYVDEEVFTECHYEKMDLTDSIVGIGVALFKDSKNLKTVKLPEKLTELPPYLFSGCTALEKVRMPNVVYSFPEGLFQNCSSLKEIPFRAGIRELSPYIFEGCSSLVSLVVPPTVERIEKRAAAGCTKLETVVLPLALREFDDTAFEDCPNIHNIRIPEDNEYFYVSEEDGCLYEHSPEGDKLRLKVNGTEKPVVNLFKENVDDETEPFFTDEDFYEEDDDFSAEVAVEDEIAEGEESDNSEDKEELVPQAAVSDEEIANLFGGSSAAPEGSEEDENDAAVTVKITDAKTQAILDSVQLSKVIECQPEGTPPADADLFVIAEILDKGDFTKKLQAVARRFAQIQDYKRIFMLYGLPVDDDEFTEFFKLYVSNRNVVFACEASSKAGLSDYGKKVCEYSRIELSHEALVEQRNNISTKNDTLIKLIIRDIK